MHPFLNFNHQNTSALQDLQDVLIFILFLSTDASSQEQSTCISLFVDAFIQWAEVPRRQAVGV